MEVDDDAPNIGFNTYFVLCNKCCRSAVNILLYYLCNFLSAM